MAYDAKKVKVIVNGVYITGFRDGDIYAYEEMEDKNTLYTGADGVGEFSQRVSNACQLTIGLKHTSPSNKYLNQLYDTNADIDVTVVDGNTPGCTISGAGGKFLRRPNSSRGKEIAEHEWVIILPDHQYQTV